MSNEQSQNRPTAELDSVARIVATLDVVGSVERGMKSPISLSEWLPTRAGGRWPSVVCVASRVVGRNSEVVAGTSVSEWPYRINLDESVAAVRTAALGLSRQLGNQ